MMGNIAMMVAQIISAPSVFLTRMMIRGAMATMGVTCRITAYGKKLRSMIGLCTNRNATTVPMAIEIASAINVTRSVIHSECMSAGALRKNVLAIRLGDGTR